MTVEDDPRLRESSFVPMTTAVPAAASTNGAARQSAAGSRRAAGGRAGRRRMAPSPTVEVTNRGGGRHRRRKPPSRVRRTAQAARFSPRRGRRRKPRSFLVELPGTVLTALLISVLIKTFLVQAFYIPSGSMENTLLVNDRVLVNKLVNKPDEIRRGDIVVFRDPGGWLSGPPPGGAGIRDFVRSALVFIGVPVAGNDDDLIKRVIGVGGDQVRCCDASGRVSVNGKPLDEPYVFPGDQPSAAPFDVTVPQDRLWLMGDHRGGSLDSRAHHGQPGASGYVPVDAVIGRAFTIVWPFERMQWLRVPETFDRESLDATRG